MLLSVVKSTGYRYFALASKQPTPKRLLKFALCWFWGYLWYSTALPPVIEQHGAAENTASQESKNQKFELLGNPVRDPSFRVRKSGKKIADFVLATHPEEEKTEYWRIRAVDKQAESTAATVTYWGKLLCLFQASVTM
jgi:Single-strand binding protein family